MTPQILLRLDTMLDHPRMFSHTEWLEAASWFHGSMYPQWQNRETSCLHEAFTSLGTSWTGNGNDWLMDLYEMTVERKMP